MAGDATGVDSPLQGIDGLAAVEHAKQLPAKDVIEKVIAQKHCPQQPSEMDDGLVKRVAAGGRSESGRDVHRAGVPGMYGGNEVHNLFPMRTDALEVNARTTDLLDARRDRRATWQKQVPIFECLQSRAQIESQELGECHREIGVAVGIDGELGDVQFLVPDDALDGRACLALIVQNQGLGMEDSPAISDV